MNKIKVLIVDDSATVRTLVKKLLSDEKSIKVVGTADNGREAIKKIKEEEPDVITMDIVMPYMDGFSTIKHIMSENPIPILVLARSAFSKGEDFIFRAIELGALEILEKPDLPEWEKLRNFKKILVREIKKMAKAKTSSTVDLKKVKEINIKSELDESCKSYIGITASSGGPGVLKKILSELPGNFPGCIFVVQHISTGFTPDFIKWLNSDSKLEVVEASHRRKIKERTVYVAPENKHLVINKLKRIELTDAPRNNGFRPSGNVMFESVGRVFKEKSIGVILSGMGKDGIDGLQKIKECGGRVIAQDPENSILPTMPQGAIKRGVVDVVSSPDNISSEIIKMTGLK